MRHVSVTATAQDGQEIFRASFFSSDPTELLGEFARNLSKRAMPSELFGRETAQKLHAAIDPLVPNLTWDAGVSRRIG